MKKVLSALLVAVSICATPARALPNATDEVNAIAASLAQSDGSVLDYWAPFAYNRMNPYDAQVGLFLALGHWPNNTPPANLLTVVQNYLTWSMAHMNWTLTTASGSGTDAGGRAYVSGQQLITLHNGDAYSIPTNFRTPAGQTGGTVASYSGGQQTQVAANVSSLFVKGATTFFYGPASGTGSVRPGWWLNTPDMSTSTPLLQLDPNGTTYKELYAGWYDDTDSVPATLVTLANSWLSYQTNATFTTWLAANFEPLQAAVDGSMTLLNSQQTGLTVASPIFNAAFTEDNIEVWRGLVDFVAILNRALTIDPNASATVSGSHVQLSQILPKYNALVAKWHKNISLFTMNRTNDVGRLNLGWAPATNTAFTLPSVTDPTYYDPFAWVYMYGFPWGLPENRFSTDAIRADYFSKAATNLASYLTPTYVGQTNYPLNYRFLVYAEYAGATNAPFSAATLSSYLDNIYATKIVSKNRVYTDWQILDAGCYIRMINTLR